MVRKTSDRGDAYEPYAPLMALKPFADEVWIVDGPEISMRYLAGAIPFPTRMTIVRLPGGELWVHSPVAWSDELGAAIAQLGEVRSLVAPNTLHYWHLPHWREKFPDAVSYGAPGLAQKAKRPLELDVTLGEAPPAAWGDVFDQGLTPEGLFTEVFFLHRPSRTLILTDLIENFEPERVRSPWLRFMMRAAGAAYPDGKAPIDMQWSFLGRRGRMRAAAEQIVAWAPERIILAHGRCIETGGAAAVRRAFRWAL